MATVTRTWGVQETLLDPQALPPPPVRHALLVFLVLLTAILHLGTAGWSEIHNGIEGIYAGGARQMLAPPAGLAPIEHGALSPFQPPLFHWLLIVSYKLFGITPVAARLPSALAMIGSVALTFLIGERLSGYWRGFAAGLIQLCSFGAFIWCRMATPEPIFTMVVEAALFCALCGYQTQRQRQLWFTGFWTCATLAFLTKGIFAIALLGTILVPLALLFREARLRYRALFHWSALLPFVAMLALWLLWSQRSGGEWSNWTAAFRSEVNSNPDQHGIGSLLLRQFIWFYPATLLVAPALLFAWRKVVRPHEFDFTDALPLCWLAAALLALLVPAQRGDSQSVVLLPAVSLLAAVGWDRSSPRLRIAGLALAALGAVAAGLALRSRGVLWFLLPDEFPAPTLHSVVPTLAVAVALASLAAAAYFAASRETLAICIANLGMLPIGLSTAETVAQLGPYLSFAAAARLVRERLGTTPEVIYEGSPQSGSSLKFYLDRQPLFIVPHTAAHGERRITAEFAVEKFGAADPVYLIIEKERAPIWQDLLTTRYHIYHQVSTCGRYVVVTNQP